MGHAPVSLICMAGPRLSVAIHRAGDFACSMAGRQAGDVPCAGDYLTPGDILFII